MLSFYLLPDIHVGSPCFLSEKPIIVYKAGRFPESAAAAASHTGAMASEDSYMMQFFAGQVWPEF